MHPSRIVPALFLIWVAAVPAADEFYRDFRTRDFDAVSFQMAGPDADSFVESTPEGLRIKFLDGENHEPTGISLRFNVSGDFEITTAYTIKLLDPPATGYGVGVGLYIETDSPTKEGITLERFVVPKAAEVFASTRASMKDGARTYTSQRFPAQSIRAGQLRLSRRGARITAYVTEGDATTFRRLQTVKVGAGELFYVRLAGDTGGSKSRLDATFLDLRIKTGDLPDEPPVILPAEPTKTLEPARVPPPIEPMPEARPGPWILWVLGVGLVVLIALGLVAYWRRRSLMNQG